MLTIDNLREYSGQVQLAIPEIKSCFVVVTADELVRFLGEHKEEDNTLMLALVPQHKIAGSENQARWSNVTAFYFLDKTDVSMYDHDGYLDVFSRTQAIARKFVDKLLSDKSDNTGLFCGFLAWLDENSIAVDPVKAYSGCNGWIVEIELKSQV